MAPPLRATDPGSNHALSKARASKGKSATANFSHTPKSRFTGSGLGLKKGEELEFQPQGSAKMIINAVLRKQEEERGS